VTVTSAQDNRDATTEELPEVTGKVHPVINAGGHSGAIAQVVFSKGGARLYTVGGPGEVHEWVTDSGERLRVWRFPIPAIRLDLSPSGKHLAVGCIGEPVPKGKTRTAPVWLIPLPTGRVRLHARV